jgi:hypothetical protein
MSHVTRFNSSYDITGVDFTSNVNITAHTLTVNGNLKIVGSVSNVASTNTQVTDNIITLNQGESGAGVSLGYAGIEVDRGSLLKTSIRWNESLDRWELTTDGSTYSAISTTSGAITAVIDDTNPKLGGNLDVLSRTIYSSTAGIVKFDDNVAIQVSTVAPSATAGYNTIYAQTPAGGGSGLFITNTSAQEQELVTKTKAIVYALIM